MQIVNHQEQINIFKSKNKAIEIVQRSFELGCDVSIWIQPENIERFCLALLDKSNKEVIK
jgi:predicted CoA-binding protein